MLLRLSVEFAETSLCLSVLEDITKRIAKIAGIAYASNFNSYKFRLFDKMILWLLSSSFLGKMERSFL